MSAKMARLVGLVLLLGAVVSVWTFTPATLPTRYSQSGFTIMKRQAIQRLALNYLLAGMAAGFGLALLACPLLHRPVATNSPKQPQGPS